MISRGKMLAELVLKKSSAFKKPDETSYDVLQKTTSENYKKQEETVDLSAETCDFIFNDVIQPETSGNDNKQNETDNLSEKTCDFSHDDLWNDPLYLLPNDFDCDSSSKDEFTNINENLAYGNDAVQNENIMKNNTRKARNIRKHNRNLGKPYLTLKGKSKSARTLIPLTKCRSNCKERIRQNNRQKIFEEYWSLGSYDQRASFVAAMMTVTTTKSHRPRTTDVSKRRSRTETFTYHLQVDGLNVKLCLQCFLKTLGESQNMTRLVGKKKKINVSGLINSDERGKRTPMNKYPDGKLEEVKAQILSFPSYESHYTRKTNDKKYLSPDLTLKKMYELYKEGYQMPVCLTTYKHEFHKLNLRFKKRQQDTCYHCDKFNMQLKMSENEAKRNEIEKLKHAHQLDADLAYEQKRVDKREAIATDGLRCFTFDLQQCLPTPSLSSSVAFYKRQLWTFNLTIYDNSSGKSYHFVWDESVSKRGANQIASCLYKFICKLPSNVERIILYSDTCGGQNKNSHIAAMFSFLLKEKCTNIKVIDHKFMVSGHSHMEVDVAHGIIEKRKKKTNIEIFHPHDWIQLIKSSSDNFTVTEMKSADFFDFAALLNSKGPLVLRTKNEKGEVYKWHDTQWLRYSGDKQFGEIQYKKSLQSDEDFQIVSFIRRGSASNVKVYPITDKPIPISMEKKKDLLSLLDLIPSVFHDFYRNLPAIQKKSIDPDLVNEELDD